jgi:hypothetical protein
MRHHTKDKGDKGLGFVIADLLASSIQVALPISEHLPFDCIAIAEDGRLSRLSVKYRTLGKHGSVEVSLRSSWADRHGSHVRKHARTEYDAIAVYCPESKKCYFVRIGEIKGGSFALHVMEPKKGKRDTIRLAQDFEDATRLFSSDSKV